MNIYKGKRLKKEYPEDEFNIISDSVKKTINNNMNDDDWYSVEAVYPVHAADKFKIVVEEVKFKE